MGSRAVRAADTLRDELQQALGSVYDIENELGGGGMSRVFLAKERLLDRAVVVKVMNPETAAGINVDRFRQEIQLAARLQHPHIVPILSAGEIGGVPFYAMPFIDGESLRSRLVRGGRTSISEAVRILHDVIDALAYAHARGVVHRDVKPENVLMSGRHALVTDFGVAKALESRNHDHGEEGFAIGTPAYMAPEQAAGDPQTDHRADIYAFGVLAYELLAGRPPFLSNATYALLAAHAIEVPAPISALRPDAPAALSAMIMRCLEKDPDERYAGALQVRDVLDGLLARRRRPVAATIVPAIRRASSMLAAAGVAAVLAAGSWVVHRTQPAGAGESATSDVRPMSMSGERILGGIAEQIELAVEDESTPEGTRSLLPSLTARIASSDEAPARRAGSPHSSRARLHAGDSRKPATPARTARATDPAWTEKNGHALRLALMAGSEEQVEHFERIAAFRDSVEQMADSIRRYISVALVKPRTVAPQPPSAPTLDAAEEAEPAPEPARGGRGLEPPASAGTLSPDASASAVVKTRLIGFALPDGDRRCSSEESTAI